MKSINHVAHIELDLDPASDEAQFLTILYNSHQAATTRSEGNRTVLTLTVAAESVEQATMLSLALLMTSDHRLTKLEVRPQQPNDNPSNDRRAI